VQLRPPSLLLTNPMRSGVPSTEATDAAAMADPGRQRGGTRRRGCRGERGHAGGGGLWRSGNCVQCLPRPGKSAYNSNTWPTSQTRMTGGQPPQPVSPVRPMTLDELLRA